MSTPIFILGYPRSGTSTLAACFSNAMNIQGYNEGHFLKYIKNYVKLTDNIFSNLKSWETSKKITIGNIDKDLFIENINKAFKCTYESLFDLNEKYWFDKTPDSNLLLFDIINKLWPESKFIMIKRRSLETISSGLIKFANVTFEQHCLNWNNAMQQWTNIDKIKLKDRFIELENYDMLFNPEKISDQLICLLPEYKDKKEKIINFFQNNFFQSSTGNKPEILDINTIQWTDEQKDMHNTICSETLNFYNYSLNKNYFLKT